MRRESTRSSAGVNEKRNQRRRKEETDKIEDKKVMNKVSVDNKEENGGRKDNNVFPF